MLAPVSVFWRAGQRISPPVSVLRPYCKASGEPCQGFSVARKAIRNPQENAPKWLARVTPCEGRRLRRRFWQPGGGNDRNITSTEALRAVIDYIHASPVRRALVARAEDWEWSSARWYAGVRPVKLEMDQPVVAEMAGDDMAAASARPSEYLRACHPPLPRQAPIRSDSLAIRPAFRQTGIRLARYFRRKNP